MRVCAAAAAAGMSSYQLYGWSRNISLLPSLLCCSRAFITSLFHPTQMFEDFTHGYNHGLIFFFFWTVIIKWKLWFHLQSVSDRSYFLMPRSENKALELLLNVFVWFSSRVYSDVLFYCSVENTNMYCARQLKHSLNQVVAGTRQKFPHA